MEILGSRTLSEHLNVEAALLPSQIEQLPDLAGYLKLASRPEWLRVSLPRPRQVPSVNASAQTVADLTASRLAQAARSVWRTASTPIRATGNAAALDEDRRLRGPAAHDDAHRV